jgi:hypothetical protein
MRRFFNCMVVATLMMLLCAMPALAEEGNYISNKIGIGYQGMIAGDYLNGISARGWIGDKFGLEASIFYGDIDAEADGGDVMDGDVFLSEVKAMYAFIVKKNSRFYVGAKGGYGKLDFDFDFLDGAGKIDDDLWTCGAFVGSEWNFQGIPELGFNFDVGYNYITYDEDDADIDLDGIAVTFGIHYYF